MIDKFEDEYFFLSNDYPVSLSINGYSFSTVTAAYEAAKSNNPDVWKRFQWLTANQARAQSHRGIDTRKDWYQVRLDVLRELLDYKFKDSYLANWLVETKPHELVGEPKGLGKLLMEIRTQKQGDIPW